MAIGYPYRMLNFSKLSKPIPSSESNYEKNIVPKSRKKVSFQEKFECSYCDRYLNEIDFQRKVILILSLGLVFKMLVDSIFKK